MTRSPLSIFLVGAVGLSLAACGSTSLSGGDAAKSSAAPASTQTADAALGSRAPQLPADLSIWSRTAKGA